MPDSVRLAHAFALVDDAVLALVDVATGRATDRYSIPFVMRDGELREAAEGDGAWRALASAIAHGRTLSAMTETSVEPSAAPAQVDAVLVCRPSAGLAEAWGADAAAIASADERALGRDQSNTSVVLGDRLLLKGYRRIQPGLNPDLEMTAFLSEEARFTGVPCLAGWAEVVTRDTGAATVAMLQAFVADGEDAYETTAGRLASLVAAPGTVSLEWATEIAADLGTLVAGLHAVLADPPADAPDFVPREATRDELHAWRADAHAQLDAAITAVASLDRGAAAELRSEAGAIAARASRFEAVATTPLVMRIHAGLHLGEVLVSGDGVRVVDFEGQSDRPLEDRRRPGSPLQDVASMLRSLDHVARSARRRAERESGGPIERPGLDTDAWIERARARFLGAYAEGLRRAGTPIVLDPDLLDAFEVARGTRELASAASVGRDWPWAAREGMRWLLARGKA